MKDVESLDMAIEISNCVNKEKDIQHLVSNLKDGVQQCEECRDSAKAHLEGYTKTCKDKFESELVRGLLTDDDRNDIWPDSLTPSDITKRALALPKTKTMLTTGKSINEVNIFGIFLGYVWDMFGVYF